MPSYTRSSNSYTSISNKVKGLIAVGNGALTALTACNTSASDRYLMLFDSANPPVNGDYPFYAVPVYGGNGYLELGNLVFTEDGLPFDNGLAWAFSSTPTTLTLTSDTDPILHCRWV